MNALHTTQLHAKTISCNRNELSDLFSLISTYCEQFNALFCSIKSGHGGVNAKGLAGIGQYLSEDCEDVMSALKEQMLEQAEGGNGHD